MAAKTMKRLVAQEAAVRCSAAFLLLSSSSFELALRLRTLVFLCSLLNTLVCFLLPLSTYTLATLQTFFRHKFYF